MYGCKGSEKADESRHVGACIDRSAIGDRIVPHALALARALGASVTLLHVLEPPPENPRATPSPIDALDWELRRTEAREHLADVESKQESAGLVIRAEILEGHPAEEIRDWVVKHDADVTVMASHGASGWTEWSLASTARKLIEGISGSVLLVPAWCLQEPIKEAIAYQRILVPLDGSKRAESALPAALRVARAHGSELLLLHVVPSPECSCPTPDERQDDELEERLVERNTRLAETYLDDVRRHLEHEGIRVRTRVVVDGDVRGELMRRIQEDRIELVILSGHGRGARAGIPLGSVATFLLDHATVPLLVVREQTSALAESPRRGRAIAGARLPHLAES